MISQVVHAEHKQPPAVVVPGLLLDSYVALAMASARVYHAQLNPKNAKWCYSRLRGTVVLGKDSAQVGDQARANNRDNGIVDSEDHWFRLLDADSGKPVWMFRIYPGFSYQQDRPFFHVFQGRSRRFGFLFENDDEATAFAKEVVSQACPPQKQRSLNLSRSRSTPTQGSRRIISTAMVSAPALDSFAHVAHVGINKDGSIEASKGIDPSWKTVLSGLQDGRASPKRTDADASGRPDFIEGFWKSIDAIATSNNSSETTIVDTANNDVSIKPKVRRRMIPVPSSTTH